MTLIVYIAIYHKYNHIFEPPMDFENLLSHSTIFTIFGLLLFLYALSSSIRRRGHKKAPPEAGGAWPLIGHLHLVGGSQPPHVTLGNMADKYGPIFTIRLGVHKTLVVNSSEMAKECFHRKRQVVC